MRTKLLRRISLSSLATRRHTIRLSLLALVGGIVSLTPLHSGVLFTFEEVGSDVVATTSGSIANGWTGEIFGARGNFVSLASNRILGTMADSDVFQPKSNN